MKVNEKTRLVGKNVILVPYTATHVQKYHEWMKSPELQHFTASEPLTLEQEYAMQKSWFEDEDKCTFIILDKSRYDKTHSEIDAMIGDTNLFFNNSDERGTAEAEIMIADEKSREKRMGWEAMILMLRYGFEKLKVNKYQVKISMDNEKSLRMFSKLKFHEVERSSVFQEITFTKDCEEDWIKWLVSETADAIRDENYE
ncbi:N-acetyltransferase 9-like protein [Athalia rosae]|uniref:N-acetyltransferase 9-like protein n=1 Tax=Athalia rosae TaxID=37344 RepID=UPI002033E16F|nr:N-acetyltransferase 9-like protein [Athalia rosae]